MFTKPTLANNRYELIGTLGQGGMACVFKALDTRLKVEKAIKIPNHQCLTNKRIRDRFENEATTMAMLHHKNIVVVHDIRDEVYEDSGGIVSIKIVYMVMEMLPGGSLQDRIEDHGPLHPQQAIEAAIQMAEGLGYAHQNNVVHRDVKLDNVLIGSDNTLKVTDFGIAQIDGGSGMTQTGATMGTLAFMAPEQKLSSRRATAISDLYSVGASLYLMLTNRNPSELYAHDIQEKGFSDLPDEVGVVLGKCCNMDPNERYQNASELIQAFKSLRPYFGDLPEDSLPFYIPSDKPKMQDEDRAKQDRKVTNMWTTLLGIDPDDLTGSIPQPNVAQPKNRASDTALDFGTFDSLPDTNTAIDILGLDLTSDFERPQLANMTTDSIDETTSVQVSSPPPLSATPSPSAPEESSTHQTHSSSKGPVIIGILALLAIGGWFAVQDSSDPPSDMMAPTESVLANNNTLEANPTPPEDNKTLSNEKSDTETIKTVAEPKTPETTEKTVQAIVEKPTPNPNSATQNRRKKKKKKRPSQKPAEKKVETPIVEPAAPTPVPTTFGVLPISSAPYSKVFVKGKAVTCKNKSVNTTPCRAVLPTGKHTVLLRTQNNQEKTITIDIVEGRNSAQCWNFSLNSQCPK